MKLTLVTVDEVHKVWGGTALGLAAACLEYFRTLDLSFLPVSLSQLTSVATVSVSLKRCVLTCRFSYSTPRKIQTLFQWFSITQVEFPLRKTSSISNVLSRNISIKVKASTKCSDKIRLYFVHSLSCLWRVKWSWGVMDAAVSKMPWNETIIFIVVINIKGIFFFKIKA